MLTFDGHHYNIHIQYHIFAICKSVQMIPRTIRCVGTIPIKYIRKKIYVLHIKISIFCMHTGLSFLITSLLECLPSHHIHETILDICFLSLLVVIVCGGIFNERLFGNTDGLSLLYSVIFSLFTFICLPVTPFTALMVLGHTGDQ